ncbi:hypothetical protein [Georgenia sp. SYP-B2076]|nr:hypothetical protein [Georgenia sp. SYP-B2076]
MTRIPPAVPAPGLGAGEGAVEQAGGLFDGFPGAGEEFLGGGGLFER